MKYKIATGITTTIGYAVSLVVLIPTLAYLVSTYILSRPISWMNVAIIKAASTSEELAAHKAKKIADANKSFDSAKKGMDSLHSSLLDKIERRYS